VIYSRFLQDRGEYAYYEDSATLVVNQDLPVPRLPSMAGRVGVPARESGRPLPGGARLIGHGPRARGLVVGPGSSFGFGASDPLPNWTVPLLFVGAFLVIVWVKT
jgi:hypothetical protein